MILTKVVYPGYNYTVDRKAYTATMTMATNSISNQR